MLGNTLPWVCMSVYIQHIMKPYIKGITSCIFMHICTYTHNLAYKTYIINSCHAVIINVLTTVDYSKPTIKHLQCPWQHDIL